jgi:hypothetical protein
LILGRATGTQTRKEVTKTRWFCGGPGLPNSLLELLLTLELICNRTKLFILINIIALHFLKGEFSNNSDPLSLHLLTALKVFFTTSVCNQVCKFEIFIDCTQKLPAACLKSIYRG